MTADELAKSIGHRILYYRMERGLTQAQVAEGADLSVSYIGMLEKGDRLPHIDVLYSVAGALDVPLAVFFTEEESARNIAALQLLAPMVTVAETLKLKPADVVKAARVVWALYSPKTGDRPPV